MPGYEPRTMQSMALGLAVNARGADHNRSGAYEADLKEGLDRVRGTDDHVRAAIETEDRAAIMDSLILCKFLRGVFTEPFAEWAGLLSKVTGWDVDEPELRETARRIVHAKRAFNLREGWTPADDWLPERFLDSPLELASGRTATLPTERLRAMIDTYYAERGLDSDGRPLRAHRLWKGVDEHDHHQSCSIGGRGSHGRRSPSTARASRSPKGRRSGRPHATLGIDIPVLCHDERYDPVGVCRMCVVDVGGRADAAACIRPCEADMEVSTATPEIERTAARCSPSCSSTTSRPRDEDPKQTTTADNELLAVADSLDDHRRRRPLPRTGARDRHLEPGDRRRPRLLHPLRPLRPGL